MAMAIRTYTVGDRVFEIVLSRAPVSALPSWTVARVNDVGRGGREVTVPGIGDVSGWAEEVALARACDRIDKWIHSIGSLKEGRG